MKTAIYNGKLITPAEVLENKVLMLENDRIIDILAEDVIDLGQYDEKIDAHGRYVCPGFIDTHSDKIEQIIQPRPTSVMDFEMGLKEIERQNQERLDGHDDRISALESAPAKRWDTVTNYALTAILALVCGLIAGHFGF